MEELSHYPFVLHMPTRWIDNDRYGHMNNAVYYSVFENTVMRFLEVEHGLDLASGDVRCFTVENGCQYHSAVKYPQELACGLRVAKIGNSSVRYELGIFAKNSDSVGATGFIVDVFVDAATERPTKIPDSIRRVLGTIQVQAGS
ncbi:MAG: acyl-CoA thioesterase [Gammaproteobacteria bacterium]|nr:acyl-CoA thioesterase [Gammaproteobacteria bacterium]